MTHMAGSLVLRVMKTLLAYALFVVATACAASPQATPSVQSTATSPLPGPAPLASCTDGEKLDAFLRRKLLEPGDHFMVEVYFRPYISEEEAMALGLHYASPGDAGVGRLDRGALERLCADPRVTRIKLSPEMRAFGSGS